MLKLITNLFQILLVRVQMNTIIYDIYTISNVIKVYALSEVNKISYVLLQNVHPAKPITI